MGCGQSTAKQEAAPAATASAGGNAGKLKGNTAQQAHQDAMKKKAALVLSNEAFWNSEAFTDHAAAGQPPQDAPVLALLVNDAADPRTRHAGVKVYMAEALDEWGSELLEPVKAVPALAAVFGLMMSCCTSIAPHQVNRHNCKLLQECVRSAALVLGAAARLTHPEELQDKQAQLRPVLLDLIKVLLAARVLLGNYAHENSWVLLLPVAKRDKDCFEALHACCELCVAGILTALLPAPVKPWSAPAIDYAPTMDKFVVKLHEAAAAGPGSGARLLSTDIEWLIKQPAEQLEPVALFTGLDVAYLHAALSAHASNVTKLVSTRSVEHPVMAERQRQMAARAAASQSQFDAIKATAEKPKLHASRKFRQSETQPEDPGAVDGRASQERVSAGKSAAQPPAAASFAGSSPSGKVAGGSAKAANEAGKEAGDSTGHSGDKRSSTGDKKSSSSKHKRTSDGSSKHQRESEGTGKPKRESDGENKAKRESDGVTKEKRESTQEGATEGQMSDEGTAQPQVDRASADKAKKHGDVAEKQKRQSESVDKAKRRSESKRLTDDSDDFKSRVSKKL